MTRDMLAQHPRRREAAVFIIPIAILIVIAGTIAGAFVALIDATRALAGRRPPNEPPRDDEDMERDDW